VFQGSSSTSATRCGKCDNDEKVSSNAPNICDEDYKLTNHKTGKRSNVKVDDKTLIIEY